MLILIIFNSVFGPATYDVTQLGTCTHNDFFTDEKLLKKMDSRYIFNKKLIITKVGQIQSLQCGSYNRTKENSAIVLSFSAA